jgi:hypothetical protein
MVYYSFYYQLTYSINKEGNSGYHHLGGRQRADCWLMAKSSFLADRKGSGRFAKLNCKATGEPRFLAHGVEEALQAGTDPCPAGSVNPCLPAGRYQAPATPSRRASTGMELAWLCGRVVDGGEPIHATNGVLAEVMTAYTIILTTLTNN